MKNIKNSLQSNFFKSLWILFALLSNNLIGQIDSDDYQKRFGNGTISLKKKINIAFIYNEAAKQYTAKVSHKYEELYVNDENSNGLTQVPFNEFQKLNLEKARYFKLDSLGNKKLIENVKVKYADVKDYFINNIFYSDLKVKQFNCSVDLPETSVLNYAYHMYYKDLKFLNSFYFQNTDEAIEEVEISIKKDPNVQFSIFEFNLDGITKTEDENYIRFKGKNLKRFKPNYASVNRSYYLPHIILSVGEIKTKKSVEKVLKSTDDLYAWYKSLIDELKPNKEILQKIAASIVEGETSDTKKIEKIFKWVQNNIQYVAFENGIAGFKPSEAHDVASVKYGDCKGMANLLVGLLKTQGFDARHAWIGTRANNYDYSIPSLVVDNHMICALNFNDKMYYLDGTSKSATWNKVPAHIEGKQVLVSNKDTFLVATIDKSKPEFNALSITGKIDLAKPIPEVNLQFKLSGHFYRDFLSNRTHASSKTKEHLPYYFLKDYLDGIKVKSISSMTNANEYVTFNVSGTYNNIAFGTKKVIFPFLDLLIYPRISDQNPPNYIDYPQLIASNIEINNKGKLPKENYTSKTLGGNNCHATYSTEKTNGKLIVKQTIFMDLLNSSSNENDSWNSFYDQVNAFNNLPLTYD